MKENIELVRTLAKPAMISFSDKELEIMSKDLDESIKIISSIKNAPIHIQELNKESMGLESLRVDKKEESLSKKDATKNAPPTKSGDFEVAMVVE